MTYFQKLEAEIKNLNDMDLLEDKRFFLDHVMNQLIVIHDLLIFPSIENEKFQQYIGWFRNDIRQDINRCLNGSDLASPAQKEELLNAIKARISPKLKVVEFAFNYYLNNKDLLNKEWAAEIRRIKTESTINAFSWQIEGSKKSISLMFTQLLGVFK